MDPIDESLKWCREQRSASAEMLEDLTSGKMKLGEKHGSSDWIDTTNDWITRLRGEIAQLDRLIVAYEKVKSGR